MNGETLQKLELKRFLNNKGSKANKSRTLLLYSITYHYYHYFFIK